MESLLKRINLLFLDLWILIRAWIHRLIRALIRGIHAICLITRGFILVVIILEILWHDTRWHFYESILIIFPAFPVADKNIAIKIIVNVSVCPVIKHNPRAKKIANKNADCQKFGHFSPKKAQKTRNNI